MTSVDLSSLLFRYDVIKRRFTLAFLTYRVKFSRLVLGRRVVGWDRLLDIIWCLWGYNWMV